MSAVTMKVRKPKPLSPTRIGALAAEIKMMLHAHRDCLRNKGVDTAKVSFDCRDGYYGEAFGIMRALQTLGYGRFGAVNIPGTLNHWLDELKDQVLAEENFGGSNQCDRCLADYGKDGAGRVRP